MKIENTGAISGTIDCYGIPLKTISDAKMEDCYYKFFNVTKTYPNSQKRKDFVNFVKYVMKEAQQ